MSEEQLWLTVLLDESDPCWPPRIKDCAIRLDSASTLQGPAYELPYRTSPLFPVAPDFIRPMMDSCTLYFYHFDAAFRVLGRLQNVGSDHLRKRLWYTLGLASVLVISEDPKVNKEVLQRAQWPPRSIEVWRVRNSRIVKVRPKVGAKKEFDSDSFKVLEYSTLPTVERAIVDELVSSIALIIPKVAVHAAVELDAFSRLVAQMNELIEELVYVCDPRRKLPKTLTPFGAGRLSGDKLLRDQIKHQVVDRLIQVNSALSYVSTQMFSGAPPILERRSLIRRHSLLGMSTAIMGLTAISRSIELAFSQFSIEDVITRKMAKAPHLPGLDRLPKYNTSGWRETHSVNTWEGMVAPRAWYPKLPYFSGRLGFRETEYTISAAIQSLTAGASLEWSLLTVTHELVHGYVRNILTAIFLGDESKTQEENWPNFYQRFADMVNRKSTAKNQLESLRALILLYCSLTYSFGSLTSAISLKSRNVHRSSGEVVRQVTENFYLLTPGGLRRQYEEEFKNASEILVHVLDLHYFYGSSVSAYIPIIWHSWSELPHVGADLRQYVLRSLLAIAAKEDGQPADRFDTCVSRLAELLRKEAPGAADVPLIREALKYLDNPKTRNPLLYPFWSSLVLVDLAGSIFVSGGIRKKLLSDPLVHWVKDEAGFEQTFEYRLPDGFCEEAVTKPAAYLLDRLFRRLRNPQPNANVEAETARLYLACCSCLEHPGEE